MFTLALAIEEERAKRDQESKAVSTRRALAQKALRILKDRCQECGLPTWDFQLADADELVMVYHKSMRGYGPTSRLSWTVDEANRLVCGSDVSSPVTEKNGTHVVEEALRITARLVLDNG